jgi:hypothetical protein
MTGGDPDEIDLGVIADHFPVTAKYDLPCPRLPAIEMPRDPLPGTMRQMRRQVRPRSTLLPMQRWFHRGKIVM